MGAVLNATCGTVVEMILSVVVLNKGNQSGSACYVELVKSNLAGKITEKINAYTFILNRPSNVHLRKDCDLVVLYFFS